MESAFVGVHYVAAKKIILLIQLRNIFNRIMFFPHGHTCGPRLQLCKKNVLVQAVA